MTAKIAHGPEIDEISRKVRHREGEFRYRRLLTGAPETPGNFVLEIVTTTHDFFSPRHMHNFDQFRFQIEGEFDFDRNGKMKPGCLAYFPEGTPYGPQTSAERAVTLTLQFGGASGSGYMSADQIEIGTAALKESGTFEKGLFRPHNDPDGRRTIDGYQAIWEFVNKRRMIYPKPRYHDPIMMYPENFAWAPLASGVRGKDLGHFSEAGAGAQVVRLEPGAQWTLSSRAIAFTLRGDGAIESERYGAHTATYCDEGQEAAIAARVETDLLVLRLPRFAGHRAASQ